MALRGRIAHTSCPRRKGKSSLLLLLALLATILALSPPLLMLRRYGRRLTWSQASKGISSPRSPTCMCEVNNPFNLHKGYSRGGDNTNPVQQPPLDYLKVSER